MIVKERLLTLDKTIEWDTDLQGQRNIGFTFPEVNS